MKKCTQCGQTLNDETKFCYKCGGANFEPAADTGAYQQTSYQQPTYQQPPQQPYYQQPAYQQQPVYSNNEPVTIGNYLIFFLLMLIPIFNIIYFIIVAVGGPNYKKSLTNLCRAGLIWAAIIFVLWLIIFLIFGAAFLSLFNGYSYY